MTKTETAKLLACIQEFWPRFMDGRDVEHVVNAWHPFFKDDDYRLVDAALKAFIATDTKGFYPTIGQLREMMRKMAAADDGESEAWALVEKAVSNSLYNAEAEFRKLPYAVQKCVGSPRTLRAWAEMDSETFSSVVASNFLRTYRSRAEWTRDYEKLPGSVKALCAITYEMTRMPGAEEKEAALPCPEPEAYSAGAPAQVMEKIKVIRERMEREEAQKAAETAKRMVERLLGNAGDRERGEGT